MTRITAQHNDNHSGAGYTGHVNDTDVNTNRNNNTNVDDERAVTLANDTGRDAWVTRGGRHRGREQHKCHHQHGQHGQATCVETRALSAYSATCI